MERRSDILVVFTGFGVFGETTTITSDVSGEALIWRQTHHLS
jgi:hypothetical protein